MSPEPPRGERRCLTYQVFLQGGEHAMHNEPQVLLESLQFGGVWFVET